MMRRALLVIVIVGFVLASAPYAFAEPAVGVGTPSESFGPRRADDLQSCHSALFVGQHGTISVQTTNGVVAWGINMVPLSRSVGRWDVFTYLNGRRTTSAFNRVTTGFYVPHGSIRAQPGQIFRVAATVVAADGRIYRSVQNSCRVP